jgi:predicted anti-sigma-YlaC factor YlaD
LRKTTPNGHFSEDLLESYALNRMREPEVAPLEEHLLICAACRSRLSEIDGYIAGMKASIARVQRTPPRRCRFGSPLIRRQTRFIDALAVVHLTAPNNRQ